MVRALRYAALVVTAWGVLVAATAPAPRVVRGPYVQSPDPFSTSIVWYTDVPAEGVLEWAAADEGEPHASDWRRVASASGPAVRHEIAVPVPPGRRFLYRVAGSAGPPRVCFGGRDGAFRFVSFGDSGEASAAQYAVARALAREDPVPELALLTGDLVYPRGADADYDPKFFAPYGPLLGAFPFFAAIGNHDYETSAGAPYFAIFSLPRNGPGGLPPESAYSFDRGPVHFVVHDSNLGARELRRSVEPWHAADVRASSARFRIAALHHSPYSSGTNSVLSPVADVVRPFFPPLFARTGIDVVLGGHDHAYERTRPVQGVVYVTTGAGGAHLYSRLLDHGFTEFYAGAESGRHSYTVVDVNGPLLQLRQKDVNGCVLDGLALYKPLGEGDTWRVWRGRSAPAADWAAPGFADSAWESAPAALGFGVDDLHTPLDDMRGQYVALFARRAFALYDAAAVRQAFLRLRFADGFAAYLNGREVARHNIRPGSTLMDGASGRHDGRDFATFDVPLDALINGRNVFAIEGRTASADAAAFVLAPELTLVSAAPGSCP